MRFFSNEGKESADEPSTPVAVQTEDNHPERVQSDPVSVPQQRSGSPWSDAPGAPTDSPADSVTPAESDRSAESDTSIDTDAELADRETPEGTKYSGDHRGDGEDSGDGDLNSHDHGPHDEAVDLPLDATDTDERSRTETVGDADTNSDTDADRDTLTGTASTDEGDQPGDLSGDGHRDDVTATSTTYNPDGTVTTVEDGPDTVTGEAEATGDTDADAATTTDDDAALKDEGGFDDPQAVDPVTDEPIESAAPTETAPVATGTNTGTDTGTNTGTDTGSDSGTHDHALIEPVPVPVAAAAGQNAEAPADKLPGSVAEPDLSSIFDKADAATFQERWRDVQLRFVDSPKDATAEAAGLLDEAVEKLATSLRAQKDSLAGTNSADTEQLRVELRGYRELLNKVLGL
jgi:hypothetical protein